MLYLYDSGAGARKIQNFETTLFKNEQLALAMKPFRCLKLDVAKDPVARERYGSKLPRFITFNAKGQQVSEVALRGYKASARPVLGVLVKTAKGHGEMPLTTFVKLYRTFLNDLDKLEDRKGTFAQKKARAEAKGSASKLKKLAKEESRIARDERDLLARERELLKGVKASTPVAANGRRMVAQNR